MARHRVVVVGAGIAGLGAAHRLGAAGAEVTVLERAGRPGGRLGSERIEGFPVDTGACLLWSADRHVWPLLRELGLAGEGVPLAPLGREQIHRGLRHPVRGRGAWGVARLPGVPLHQARRVTRLSRLLRRYRSVLDPDAPERAARVDDRSVADLGRLYFGSRVVERWLSPFLSVAAPCDVEEASRALFLLRYPTHDGATPWTLRRGLEALPEALASRLAPRLHCEVTGVDAAGPRGGVQVRFREGGAEERIQADAVVLAVPPHEASRLAGRSLAAAEREVLESTRYEPVVAAAVGAAKIVDRRGRFLGVPHAEGWPIDTLRLEVGGPAGRIPDGCSLALLRATPQWSRAHLDAPDVEVGKALEETLERVYPGACDALLFTRVQRTAHGVPRFDVGRFRELARFRSVQRELRREGRRLYFAGDYLAGPWVDAALGSGLRAAGALLGDLGAAPPGISS